MKSIMREDDVTSREFIHLNDHHIAQDYMLHECNGHCLGEVDVNGKNRAC